MVKKALLGQVGDAEIRLLRVFKAVVECGGMAAAELELNIGRSTVSRHVMDLEERLGLVLCRRGRSGFALTPDGQRVYQSALRLLEALQGFRADVHELHADLSGTLSVGLFDKTATNPQARLPQALGLFRQLAPQVTLELTVGSLNQLESAVIDGRMGLAVVPDHRRSESLSYVPLFPENMYLYAAQGHPLFATAADADWQTLRRQDYAGLAFHSPNMEVTHRFGLQRTASVNDQEALALLVLSGRYIGFLPDHYAEIFLRQGRLRRLGPADAGYEVQFVAIMRASPAPTRPVKAFLALLQQVHAPGRSPSA